MSCILEKIIGGNEKVWASAAAQNRGELPRAFLAINLFPVSSKASFGGGRNELDTPVPPCKWSDIQTQADFCFPTSRARGAPTRGRPFLLPMCLSHYYPAPKLMPCGGVAENHWTGGGRG